MQIIAWITANIILYLLYPAVWQGHVVRAAGHQTVPLLLRTKVRLGVVVGHGVGVSVERRLVHGGVASFLRPRGGQAGAGEGRDQQDDLGGGLELGDGIFNLWYSLSSPSL